MTADEALRRLKEGNERYIQGELTHCLDLQRQRIRTATNGQQPFASILCCADSRTVPEFIFDQGIGELFIVRVAGNISGASEIGSFELAWRKFPPPLLVVLGHTDCGAVSAAFSGTQVPEYAEQVIACIRPVVEPTRERFPALEGPQLADQGAVENVRRTIDILIEKSAFLREMLEDGKLVLAGAVYDLSSGRVEWLEERRRV